MVNKQVGHVELDRSGLTAVLDQYLAAVLRHKPSEAPLADNYRSTENVADVKLGEGIWKTAVALGKLQLHYTDPVTQQAGYYGLIEETTGTAITTLRLQVVDRMVTEAEWLITRPDKDNITDFDGFVAKPPPQAPLSDELRSSREDLLAAAKSYHDGISTYNWSLIRSCPDCYRIENGFGQPPNEAEHSGLFGLCNDFSDEGMKWPVPILDRHYFADEEAGIVWVNAILKSPFPSYETMKAGRIDITRQSNEIDPYAEGWFPGLYASYVFRIEQGKIRRIYHAMQLMPRTWDRSSVTGFSTFAW